MRKFGFVKDNSVPNSVPKFSQNARTSNFNLVKS